MEIQKPLRAALYIRVSTEEQAIDGLSAPAQIETLKQYCSAFGMEVFDIYADLGLSGKSLKGRLGLDRLMEACCHKRFDTVLVWKISRLSRNLKDLLFLIDIFERNGVHFASCSEKFDTSTPVGRMTLQLLGSIAEFERNTIIENVKLGLQEFARKGGKASTVLGYDNTDKRLLINEQEANIVRLIFSLYADGGMSFSAIASYLNSFGHKTKRGKPFRSSSIAYILRNPVYIGINRHSMNSHNEYSIDGHHQAIINSSLWEKAQKLQNNINKRIGSSTTYYYLSALPVYCMKCGSELKIFHTSTKGKKYTYLRCPHCSNYVNCEKLHLKVLNEINTIMHDELLSMKAYARIDGYCASEQGFQSMEIASLEREIQRLLKSKERYFDLFESYKLAESTVFVDRIREIETQLDALKNRRTILSKLVVTAVENTAGIGYKNRPCPRYSAGDTASVKLYASHLIKSISAFRNDIRIILYI